MGRKDEARHDAHEYFKVTGWWTFILYGISLVVQSLSVLILSIFFCAVTFSFKNLRDDIDLEQGDR